MAGIILSAIARYRLPLVTRLGIFCRVRAITPSQIRIADCQSTRRPGQRAFAEQMHMQMRNAFAGIGAVVDDHAIAGR